MRYHGKLIIIVALNYISAETIGFVVSIRLVLEQKTSSLLVESVGVQRERALKSWKSAHRWGSKLLQ